MQVLKVSVKPQKDRLDQFVSTSIKQLSRSKTSKLIRSGNILVNKASVDPNYHVRKGDTITVEIPIDPETSLKPESIPIKIVYEDKNLLVVDKEAGLVVHPTVDHPSGTLVNAILDHLGEFEDQDLRPGIVHRLDKNTSGLIVIAKTQPTLENLKLQFKNRQVSKKYLALVSGKVEKEFGEIVEPIARHGKFKQKFAVDVAGKEAKTQYRVVERLAKFTLLELTPLTGRTHQLRVHLSHIGHPIVGDKLYGGKMVSSRQFLHASELKFSDPEDKKTLVFHSDLPIDLQQVLAKIRS